MKKVNFFSAKTLAAVAFASLMFTSCDQENFSVTPVDPVDPADPTVLADAAAIVSATTVDANNSIELNATYTKDGAAFNFPYKATATNGVIAGETLNIKSTVEGYYTTEKNIEIPAVAKGQMIYIPAVFYTSALDGEAQSEVKEMATVPTKGTAIATTPDFTAGKENSFTVEVPYGVRIVNLEDVLAEIDALTYADGRALSENQIMENVKYALKKLANNFADFNYTEHTFKAYIPEKTAEVSITVIPFTNKGKMMLSTTQEGKTWSVEADIEEVVYNNIALSCIDDKGHGHMGHIGHGHGAGANAGGGSAGK